MNTRLLFVLLWLTPTLCFGALSTDTSYFLNVEALTNVTARSAVRGLTGVFTNSLSSAGFNTSGATNVTLTGNLMANGATYTNSVGFGDGTVGVPSIAWTSDADGSGTGFYRKSANRISVASNGVNAWDFVGNDLASQQAGGQLALSATGPLVWNGDSVIGRDNVALRWQFGTDSATPSQTVTIKGPDGSGSNIAGGALNLAGGVSTGTGAGGALNLLTSTSAGGTSSSQNTLSQRFHAAAKWVTLTSATATTLFTIPIPATNYVGLTATVTVYATDGTDHQSKTSVITVDAIAKTTTITPTISQVDNTTAASAGTLTCTYTAVDNTSNVLAVKATADSSLTETVLRAKFVITAINASGTDVVTDL